jgi:hypothetical protein
MGRDSTTLCGPQCIYTNHEGKDTAMGGRTESKVILDFKAGTVPIETVKAKLHDEEGVEFQVDYTMYSNGVEMISCTPSLTTPAPAAPDICELTDEEALALKEQKATLAAVSEPAAAAEPATAATLAAATQPAAAAAPASKKAPPAAANPMAHFLQSRYNARVGRAERPSLTETTTTEASPPADFAAMYEAAPKPPSSETGPAVSPDAGTRILNDILDSSEGAAVQVLIELGHQNTKTMAVSLDRTVKSLMQDIGSLFGVEVQRLKHGGKDLSPNALVSKYGIKQHHTIEVDGRLRGGGNDPPPPPATLSGLELGLELGANSDSLRAGGVSSPSAGAGGSNDPMPPARQIGADTGRGAGPSSSVPAGVINNLQPLGRSTAAAIENAETLPTCQMVMVDADGAARPHSPPPQLSAELYDAIAPAGSDRSDGPIIPSHEEMRDAAERLDPGGSRFNSEIEAMDAWVATRDARWQAETDAAALARKQEVSQRLQDEWDAAKNARAIAELEGYESELKDLQLEAREAMADEASAEMMKKMHDWQFTSFGKFHRFFRAGYQQTMADVDANPNRCTRKPSCPARNNAPGTVCTCTRTDKLIYAFHVGKHRVTKAHCVQSSGKTFVEAMLPLLCAYDDLSGVVPPELRTRDVAIITAPSQNLIDQMRNEGLGVTNEAVLATLPMHTRTGIPVATLAAFNRRIKWLTDTNSTTFDFSEYRGEFSIFAGTIQMMALIIKKQKERNLAPHKRMNPSDVRLIIGDEAHKGQGWLALPWDKPDSGREGSWVNIIQHFNKSMCIKFSASLKDGEEDIRTAVECRACPLMQKNILAIPIKTTWSYEGLARSDGSLMRHGMLEKAHGGRDGDVRMLRYSPMQPRCMATELGIELMSLRSESRGLPWGGMWRTITGTSRFRCEPDILTRHLNAVFLRLPEDTRTGRK